MARSSAPTQARKPARTLAFSLLIGLALVDAAAALYLWVLWQDRDHQAIEHAVVGQPQAAARHQPLPTHRP